MSILYLLTVPESPMGACDAVVQDAELLARHFSGRLSYLYPGREPGTRFPRRWWGMQRVASLLRSESDVSVHHIFNPDPFRFSVLRFLRRPIVYTVVAGVQCTHQEEARNLAQKVHTIVVPTEADNSRLRKWGITNSVFIAPAIEGSRFTYSPVPADLPPTLLMGSAPWTREQFRTKGVDALLKTVQSVEDLRLVLLWRGVLNGEIVRRIRAMGLEERVEVLNERVNVNDVLARVHAAVALADGDGLIKAYPHSLLEALAAGRPVLVSRSIPMAQYVVERGSGVVIEQLEPISVQRALEELLEKYDDFSERVLHFSISDFAPEKMLTAYRNVYGELL